MLLWEWYHNSVPFRWSAGGGGFFSLLRAANSVSYMGGVDSEVHQFSDKDIRYIHFHNFKYHFITNHVGYALWDYQVCNATRVKRLISPSQQGYFMKLLHTITFWLLVFYMVCLFGYHQNILYYYFILLVMTRYCVKPEYCFSKDEKKHLWGYVCVVSAMTWHFCTKSLNVNFNQNYLLNDSDKDFKTFFYTGLLPYYSQLYILLKLTFLI